MVDVAEAEAAIPLTPASTIDRHIAHMAPSRATLLALLAIAFLITTLIYGLVVQVAYSQVANAVLRANAVENTLRTLPNYPIGPGDSGGVPQLAGANLDTASAFAVLQRWGVFNRSVQIAQVLKGGKSVEQEKLLLDTMIRCSDRSVGSTTLDLIRCSFPEFGGAENTGLEKNCLWLEVQRVLAGYPGSADSLARQVANSLTNPDSSKDCARHSDWDPFRFTFDWFAGTQDDAGLIRNMLLATRTLEYPSPLVDNGAGQRLPEWFQFSELRLRFFEEAVSRIQTDGAVKAARSWLVLWRGPEQFFLVFTSVALLALLGDRIYKRRILRREARYVLEALNERLDTVLKLRNPARTTAAKTLATELESRDSHGLSRFVQFESGVKDLAVRADSVVLFMAEKAVRRIVLEPRALELFRQTCEAINSEVERSGWLLRYASRALPAIGFIGTVRGIMLALPAAQNLFGVSGPAQIAALSGVIEPLGLAFATTLIALVAGLITGFVGDWEITQEQVLLSRIEESLIDRIDPAED